MMTRFIINNQIDDINGLKLFDYDDYSYHESLSNDKELVFTR